jgi:hypothetical protein
MHLRRALLLFAIVLGLAAIVTSVSQPPGREHSKAPPPTAPVTAVARPPQDLTPRRIRFSTTGRVGSARLGVDRPAMVTVRVEAPGQVDIRGLGLTAAAEPTTPASFDVLAPRAGSYRVEYTPSDESIAARVGTIVVR